MKRLGMASCLVLMSFFLISLGRSHAQSNICYQQNFASPGFFFRETCLVPAGTTMIRFFGHVSYVRTNYTAAIGIPGVCTSTFSDTFSGAFYIDCPVSTTGITAFTINQTWAILNDLVVTYDAPDLLYLDTIVCFDNTSGGVVTGQIPCDIPSSIRSQVLSIRATGSFSRIGSPFPIVEDVNQDCSSEFNVSSATFQFSWGCYKSSAIQSWDNYLYTNASLSNLVISYQILAVATPTSTATPLPTATMTPTPRLPIFLPIIGYEYTYSLEPQPGLYPVMVDEYWTAYLIPNWFWPLVSTLAVTTTEGYFVPDISCNQPPAGGVACQDYDGDRVISPTKLIDLCGSAGLVQSYVVALEPACNGSQFRNASLNNFSTGQVVNCTSASPKCWLTAYDLDEIAMVVDLDNNPVGLDYRLKIYPLQGGSDDFLVIGLATILTCFFSVFVSSKKVETFGRGLMFLLVFIPYFMVGGSVTQASRLYYFYLFFEVSFTALDFARYRLFFVNRRS